jgi:tetratricopeptide (TPR) repeat protein
MTPLFTDATYAVARLPDPQIRDLAEQAVNQLEKLPDYLEKFKLQIEQNQTLADCLAISNTELESAYEKSWVLFRQKDFLSALPLALYCSTFQSTEPRYAFVAASCLHRLRLPEEAAKFYTTVLQLDEVNIAAAYRLGECLLELGDKEDASYLFEWTLTLSRGNFEHRQFHDWAMQRLAKIH